ncbi:MAG: preprotein translocase subunit YajC [Clostridiales Family XIII bacterium]|nr:preprotein translocase subunit YajC [Clostridiales Family XIII bacterium]
MNNITTLIPLILLIVIMYFMLIRPQRKREREVNSMRSAIKVGDEVITIGGICGKIVKTKDEVLTIQVGADKTKFDIMRWAISKVVTEASAPKADKAGKPAKDEPGDESGADDIAAAEGAAEESKPTLPKRLKKKTAEEEAGIEE